MQGLFAVRWMWRIWTGESVWLHQAEALTGRMSRNVCEWSAKKELEMVVVGWMIVK